MNSEASKRNKWKNQFIFQLKYFLNVIRIQRAFRKYKEKCSKNIVYEYQLAKAVNNIYFYFFMIIFLI